MNVQDRRRLLGPANAKPLTFNTLTTSNESDELKKTVLKNEALEVALHTGFVSNSNGSSLVEVKDVANSHHETSLITSVYGPRAIRGSFTSQASLNIQLKNGSLEKYSSSQLKEVGNFLTNIFKSVINLPRYAKSGIDIFIYLIYDKEIQSNEKSDSTNSITSILPHCITGITLALVDAGIEIIDMAAGGIYKGNVFAFIKSGEEIIGFWKDEGNREDIMNSIDNCKKQYDEYKNMMLTYLVDKENCKAN
ncbi:hypothetical protein TBLA_0C04350 [Henningerozyma blattae CBS 6284]|uniref:Exoribonuclease phosphorolytic domain-containing protein n=1 Tax=Henningerozyma blattae (strain ATCC 34711 / CBS 6284 / DSM 70876 / NBRC 10599 / NRRL Y-10934 / UCD 77-7) TaxID=1071380 RepID=I2H1I1_HENB6|nr:hypothetical protein TBLA_0C04350 [Tetrapisispora blattae CBS 6284]CCH60233.1 hypothetical protein TBLA_0C04350 [Tetrapisispora blattae CBS 6284]